MADRRSGAERRSRYSQNLDKDINKALRKTSQFDRREADFFKNDSLDKKKFINRLKKDPWFSLLDESEIDKRFSDEVNKRIKILERVTEADEAASKRDALKRARSDKTSTASRSGFDRRSRTRRTLDLPVSVERRGKQAVKPIVDVIERAVPFMVKRGAPIVGLISLAAEALGIDGLSDEGELQREEALRQKAMADAILQRRLQEKEDRMNLVP